MNYSAKELFPDWYRDAVNKDVSNDELANRRVSIDAILLETSSQFWTSLLMVYLGQFSNKDDAYHRMVKYFKDSDEFFSIKNDHLLRTLLGCAIAEKIEANDSQISDFCAVAILINSKISDQQLVELSKISLNFWISECESKRQIHITKETPNYNLSYIKSGVPTISAETAPDGPTLKKFGDKVNEALNSVIKEFGAISSTISILKTNNDHLTQTVTALAEECNVLWWLFGGNSILLKTPLKEIPDEIFGVILALELNKLTTELPGIGKIENLLKKAIENKIGLNEKSFTIKEIASHFSKLSDQQSIRSIIASTEPIMEIAPILSILKTAIDNTDIQSLTMPPHGITVETPFSSIDLASQLYLELMLGRIYNKI